MPPPQGFPNPLEGPGDYDVTTEVHSDVYAAISPLQFDMQGKAVLVTGGTRGIGKAIVLAYARAGASHLAVLSSSGAPDEFVSDVKTAAQNAGRGVPTVMALTASVTKESSLRAAAETIEAAFGKLDVVVNNAGVLAGKGPVMDSDPDEWFGVFEVNVKGAYLVSRAFLPLLMKSEAHLKYVVQTASVGAFLLSPGLSAYQISKTAMLRFSEFLNKEYGDQGIVSFAIHPGNVETSMTQETVKKSEPLQKIFVDSPELCGETLVYLTALDRRWIAGRYINVTWDMPELMSKESQIVKDDKLKLGFFY